MESSKGKEFKQLVHRHKETIYTVCLMNAADQDEAQDLMQEALVQLWRAFGSFRGDSSEKTWVWRICSNTCISYCRKERKNKDKIQLEVSNFLTVDEEDSKQIQMLHDRIHRLRPFDRVIALLWMEDLSYEEIGEIVGISAKNVSVRLFRIKEQLRQMSNPNAE